MCKQLVSQGNMSLYFANDEQRGFIDSLNFRVDDKVVSLVYDSINIDICKIVLNKPLLPNDTILITTPFRIKIPDAKFSRLGHVGQSYMISQWYPKPAVYDKDGWHTMPYLSQGGNFCCSVRFFSGGYNCACKLCCSSFRLFKNSFRS